MTSDLETLLERTGPTRRWATSLRQEILDSLDVARAADVQYIGGRAGVLSSSYGLPVNTFCKTAGWESAGFAEWHLPDDIYDMRQTLRYLAEKHGRIDADGAVTKEFQVQFSRAVRELCERRELIADDPDLPTFVHRRFVRRGVERPPEPVPISPTMQAIMDTLDVAKHAGVSALGSADGIIQCSSQRRYWQRYEDAGWEKIDYRHWRIPDDVYDLRVSLAYLQVCKPGFGSMFSSATQRLIASGALIGEAPDLPKLRQRRFVKRGTAGSG
jgi:hypothetical protein